MNQVAKRLVREELLFPLLILGVGLIAYHNSLQGALVFDDQRIISHIRSIDSLWGGERPLLGTSWRPVTDATFLLNRLLGRRVTDYHAINLLIHLGCAVLLYAVVRRTLLIAGLGENPSYCRRLAFVCAAVWVCHPLTTGAVTYIAQRYEALMGFFYLLLLYCMTRVGSAVGAGVPWGIFAIVACWLGMGSKEVMITAPVAAVMYDWLFVARGSASVLLKKRWWLYAGLVVGWGILVLLARAKVRFDVSRYYVWRGFSPLYYVFASPGVMARYLRLVFWPVGLCFDYAWPVPSTLRAGDWVGLVVLLVAILSLAIAVFRRKYLAFPLSCSFLVLAPTLFVPRPDPVVEYRMYLPLAGVICFSVAGISTAVTRLRSSHQWARSAYFLRWFSRSAFVGIVAVLTFLTVHRNEDYRSAERLWRKVIAQRPDNLRARVALGTVFLAEGRESEAEVCFREVVRLSSLKGTSGPGIALTARALALKELGMLSYSQGKVKEAVTLLQEAVKIAPSFEGASNCLVRIQAEIERTTE
ncbi:MAG: tetratricopeptide repeat protein [Kiritimatiellia bacterium]